MVFLGFRLLPIWRPCGALSVKTGALAWSGCWISATMKPRWGSVRRIQEAWQRSSLTQACHATPPSSSTTGSYPLLNKHICEAVSSYYETLGSPSTTTGTPYSSLRHSFESVPHLWNTMSKPRMNTELSTLLQIRASHVASPWSAMKTLGYRTRCFSSQSRVVAEEGSRGAKLAMESRKSGKRKSEAMLMYLVAMVTAMVGITYAAVPLYRKFCQATGYGGTVQRRETVEEKIARHQAEESAAATRELVVQFNADVADGMPWKFTPCQREIRVRPGQSTLAFYTAENNSSTPITGVSTYNVSPMKAGIYFNKIQCFCFEEQRLLPGEKIDMPVFFYIDPEFGTDPKMNGINSLILSYTFFKVEEAPQQA